MSEVSTGVDTSVKTTRQTCTFAQVRGKQGCNNRNNSDEKFLDSEKSELKIISHYDELYFRLASLIVNENNLLFLYKLLSLHTAGILTCKGPLNFGKALMS